MTLTLRHVLAGAVLLVGLVVSGMFFLVGSPVLAAGAPVREPVDVACVDPWVETHPAELEPSVDGEWSWWPPGLTCTHASGEVYVEPSASDAVGVAAFGLLVLALGVVPTVAVARGLWRSAPPPSRLRETCH
ncbi:hypothetical protein [Nocardioides coralli]|uniref:hypothetical protein n=1 Tax=Nocardioides coralli TaxID=2872154 RepID=UPI001CA43A64|nr:hypothetical protein [Nocardioides coralli]QZY28974.1 hypothetical protein K6T13_16290 [Nocardioides coralli]